MFFKKYKDGFLIRVKINPNKKDNKILNVIKMENGMDFLKIDIAENPIKLKANDSLILFLSDIFNVTTKKIQLINGEKNKFKNIYVMDKNIFKMLQEFQEKGMSNSWE